MGANPYMFEPRRPKRKREDDEEDLTGLSQREAPERRPHQRSRLETLEWWAIAPIYIYDYTIHKYILPICFSFVTRVAILTALNTNCTRTCWQPSFIHCDATTYFISHVTLNLHSIWPLTSFPLRWLVYCVSSQLVSMGFAYIMIISLTRLVFTTQSTTLRAAVVKRHSDWNLEWFQNACQYSHSR